MKATEHDCKQQATQSTCLDQNANGASDCKLLREVIIDHSRVMRKLTSMMKHVKPEETLSTRPCEDEHVRMAYQAPLVCNDCVINLMKLRKSKLREKFRDALRHGVLIKNAYLFAHHCRNN